MDSAGASRKDGRGPEDLRPIKVTRGWAEYAEGSALYEAGNTKVLVTASIEERVPDFLRGKGRGWVTAEYAMLPRSTHTRSQREVSRGRPSGRTQEIQRLVGRALRAVCDLPALGERTIWIDCDVLQADGGTRTASISGAYLALADACAHLVSEGKVSATAVRDEVAAVSVGIVGSVPLLDLCYEEDSAAEVDMNIVMTGSGEFVEVQGTAEGAPFSGERLGELIGLASKGVGEIVALQRSLLGTGIGG